VLRKMWRLLTHLLQAVALVRQSPQASRDAVSLSTTVPTAVRMVLSMLASLEERAS
jgi:hypothetical protein